MKWFHKEDGGLIKIVSIDPNGTFETNEPYFLAYCSICHAAWTFAGSGEETVGAKVSGCIRFFSLSKHLQSVALEEML